MPNNTGDLSSSDNAFDSADFRRVLGNFPTGVTVVTAMTDSGAVGLTIGSFTSVSLEPPLVLFCPERGSGAWAQMSATKRFCVNVLGADQADIGGVFARKSQDRFAGVNWSRRVTGAPVLDGSIAWIDCVLHAVHDGGDHHIVVGLVKALATENDHKPLLFFRGQYGSFEAL